MKKVKYLHDRGRESLWTDLGVVGAEHCEGDEYSFKDTLDLY